MTDSTAHIDPTPTDRPKGTVRDLRRQLKQAPDVGQEFSILRELRRRRQARTVTRKERT